MRSSSLQETLERHGVKGAYLFGSRKDAGTAYLKGHVPSLEPGSDLDMGVVFGRELGNAFQLYGELYAALCLLFEPFDLDLVFLEETAALFQYEAICGERVYCHDEGFLDDYEERVIKIASDLAFKKVGFERDFLEAVRDGYFEIAPR